MRVTSTGHSLRLEGVPAGADVRVLAEDVLASTHHDVLPRLPGTWRQRGDRRTFEPRLPFVAGRRYVVLVDGDPAAHFEPLATAASRSEVRVSAVAPSGRELPRNLLRLYVCFSGRMSDGDASRIRFEGLDDVFLPTPEELWDPTRTRLTLFLDPARIKRGLVAHEELGYPLREGARVRLVIDGMHHASGAPVDTARFDFSVGPDLRHRVDPEAWRVSEPRVGSREPLVVGFDRALDRGLLERCITSPVAGCATIGPGEVSWSFVPDEPWQVGPIALEVDAVLEDVAGNSVRRAFDRDLADPRDDPLDVDVVSLVTRSRGES